MPKPLALVTGVTGFIAGHVALQLLEDGYRVRGLTSVKIPGLEFIEVDDIAAADLSAALKGVDVVMHVAAPLPGRTSVEGTLSSALEGTLNIVRQAEKLGIRKMVITATFGNVVNHWGKTSREEILEQANPFYTYFAAKNLAERALWDFAKSHPSVDIATILPGFVHGPYAKGLPPPAGVPDLGSNLLVYELINGKYPAVLPPWIVDVRDIALAHVRALSLPPSAPANIGAKRFLVNGGNLVWRETAAAVLRTRGGEAGLNIAPLAGFEDLPGPASFLDTTRALKILGIKFRDPLQSMLEAVDDLLVLQRKWTAAPTRN
ncbi:NAD(P)-binding protein [Pholiota conissans]|uniref:NAD(P)-binding protein n=1 Tax=Pholiota conissans TaxID=109636 RepID=A0A9P5YS41_9AGAR|nr:NAD(P)-binding protein [Pholiota conissans]